MKIVRLPQNNNYHNGSLFGSPPPVFASDEWIELFGHQVHRYGIISKSDELMGVFFLYEMRKFGLKMFRCPPYTPDIGPILKINATNPVSRMNTHKKYLSMICDFIDDLPYAIISFSVNKEFVDMQPFIWKKFKVVPNYTYIIDLKYSVDDIIKRMSAERRGSIKKGKKDGLEVKQTTDYRQIRSIVMKTFARQKMKIDEYHLDKVLFDFAKSSNSFAFVTYRNDSLISGAFCIHDHESAYYILGGYDSESKHHGAMALSMLESIKMAKAIGLKYFDFEGSMIPQIERFFRGFGGKLTPYYRINKAKLPIELALKFVKREIF